MIIKVLLFPVILLLVLYFFIAQIVPTAKSISAQKLLITQEQEKLDTAKARLQKMQSFQQEIDAHAKEMAYVNDFVPNDQKEELLLSDISQLAQQSDINLFSVGFSEGRSGVRSESASDGKPYLIETNLIATGSYENFKAFTNRLFRMKRLYGFKSLDLSKGESKKTKEEGETDGADNELVLNGTISFVYDYIPGMAQISPGVIGQPINYDLIDAVMEATAQTNPLVSQPNERPNPFLP